VDSQARGKNGARRAAGDMSQGRSAKSRREAIVPAILLAGCLGIASFVAYGGGEALRRNRPFAQDPTCSAVVMRAIAMRHARLSLGYQVMQTPPRVAFVARSATRHASQRPGASGVYQPDTR